MDKPVFEKGLVIPNKLICLSKTHVSNAQGSPWGMLIPSPQGRDKIAYAPPPEREQMPRGCLGGKGTAGIDWYIMVSKLNWFGFGKRTLTWKQLQFVPNKAVNAPISIEEIAMAIINSVFSVQPLENCEHIFETKLLT